LDGFASSRSLSDDIHTFSKYLLEHGILEPTNTLSLIETALNNPYESSERDRLFGGEELIRVVLHIYADPGSTEAIRRSAMNLFDKLMERYAVRAYQVLDEWDRV
jgi:hypothetical protein